MASINEVMSHKNRDPNWMTDSQQQQGEVPKKKQTAGSNEKLAVSQPKAPKAPEIPQTHFRVQMCCNKCEEKAKEEAGEVAGVLSVITDPTQSKVTVLGRADSAAILKKLKKHVHKKATYWPVEQQLPVAKPDVAVSPPAQNGSEGAVDQKPEKVQPGKGSAGDQKKMENASKGVDDKELAAAAGPGTQNQPAAKQMAETTTRAAGSRMVDPRMLDAMRNDPRMVDPRMLDPRMVDPRILEAMRSADPRMMDPRMVDPRMMDPRMVDPRQVRGPAGPVDPREMRAAAGPMDPRGMMRGSAEVREGWLVDPRDQMTRGTTAGHGDMRSSEMRPIDPREMRGMWAPPVDPRDHQMMMMRGMQQQPVDPRSEKIRSAESMKDEAGQHTNPREITRGSSADHMRDQMMRPPLDARQMQAYEYASGPAAADWRREIMQQHPAMDPHDSKYGFDPPREMRGSPQLPKESYYMSSNKSRESATVDSQYQPKASYFSDYRPSQSYPANYSSSAGSYYEELPVTNPNYMKQVMY
ncbi:unnamed protein product [Sphagnum compactum]